MGERQQFCDECEVSMDLHPDGSEPWSCEVASMRANLIGSFWDAVTPRALAGGPQRGEKP